MEKRFLNERFIANRLRLRGKLIMRLAMFLGINKENEEFNKIF